MNYVVSDRYNVSEVTRFLSSIDISVTEAKRLDYSVYELINLYVY